MNVNLSPGLSNPLNIDTPPVFSSNNLPSNNLPLDTLPIDNLQENNMVDPMRPLNSNGHLKYQKVILIRYR